MAEKTTQTSYLKLQLEQSKWSFLEIESEPQEWWAAEIWHLRSAWSPEGPGLWVTLLVDPMVESGKPKRDSVWAAGAGSARPASREEASSIATLLLGRGWRDEAAVFLAVLQQFRLQRNA